MRFASGAAPMAGDESLLDESIPFSDEATPGLKPSVRKPYSDLDVRFEILLQTPEFVAINKPPGFHVHQPEDPRYKADRELICLNNLRNQLDTYLYPVHRLDVGTEGVLLFALTKEAATGLAGQFQQRLVKKTYFAITRGWPDDAGEVDVSLDLDSTGLAVECFTSYKTHQRVEMPFEIGKRHKTARYALVEAKPETGRYHQIRRHMARLSHPLVGDSEHGDSHHNKYFRHVLGEPGLWLKAKVVEFHNPVTGEPVRIESDWTPRWDRIFNQLGFAKPGSSK
jgi:tRNA pseudouridine65 synthase